MRRRAFLGALLTMAGSLAAEQARAQCGIGHRHFAGHGSYSPCNYWTPRLYPVVACCRGVTQFEQPPGAAYRVCLKKYHNPDFVGYHGAYSGYDRVPQGAMISVTPAENRPENPTDETAPSPRYLRDPAQR